MERQTIKQYMASVEAAGAPDDMDYQVQAWPYPQAEESHIAIFRKGWPHEPGYIPDRQIRIPLINSDKPGVLMRVCNDAKRPKEVVELLMQA